jgi:2-amino-4-hydroxy-6-hydroxymethyldihydropteridine diphosphokinase
LKQETAYVALGSNLGDRESTLASAVAALRASIGVRDVILSPLYETDPVGPGEQRAYLNAVARVDTSLPPGALLELLLAIEANAGRTRVPERNAPRTLDLDLLLYGDRRVDEDELEVPHPRMWQRGFVLEPLRDLAPDLVAPGQCERVEVLASRVHDPDAVRRFET